ncbi:unnamed protein product [Taenia asiatica]|uniref:DDE_3 domain-containing protein n=1 Tax=Taenia asiatica TaxID=60517 RepID=A0A0R3VXD3_TAEAS|nr:unnamed protein product [Taenia asiatica]
MVIRFAYSSSFWIEDIIGQFFFPIAAGQAITVSAARYRDMVNQFLPESHDVHVDDVQLQQDGATCHRAREVVRLFWASLPVLVIAVGRSGHEIQRLSFS